MSTRGGVSAFGVIHKSEYEPGKYKPATKLTPAQRQSAAATARTRRPAPTVATPQNRGLGAVFAQHSYADRPAFGKPDQRAPGGRYGRGADSGLRHEFDPKHHTASESHPKIHYGSSVPPSLRSVLDRDIDPKFAAKLKHPVAIHHDPKLTEPTRAAAVPAHVTTGNRGHVVLGSSYWSVGGKYRSRSERGDFPARKDIINHELGHAELKRAPRVVPLTPQKAVGEEARADARTGSRSYPHLHQHPVARALNAARKVKP